MLEKLRNGYASISQIAKPLSIDGWQQYNFSCINGINYIANDSDSNSLFVIFDREYGTAGEIEIKAGEAVSDLMTKCQTMSVCSRQGDVPFRALGV